MSSFMTPTPLLAWIASIRPLLCPPVGNKLLFGAGQHKVMVVGGPNVRSDYHVEAGEEFFLQLEGDMDLLIVPRAGAAAVSIPIREGEAFVLPARVPHSPQRRAGTVGFVMERERVPALAEIDALRWYAPDWSILYEERFPCTNLGTQLPPVIHRFNASKTKRTGVPPPPGAEGTPPLLLAHLEEPDAPPFAQPINVKAWVAEKRAAGARGATPLWGPGAPAPRGASEYSIVAYIGAAEGGEGMWSTWIKARGEVFIYQRESLGAVAVRRVGDACDGEERVLKENDVLLVPKGPFEVRVSMEASAYCLIVTNPIVI